MEDRPGRRERTKAQNRETILTAAERVFAELGFAAATVRDVIRATPLASGTFYNYFKSKEEVYQALRDQIALQARPRLRAARLAAETGRDFIAANFREYFSFLAERRQTAPQGPDVVRFRMDSPEVVQGLSELRQDIDGAIAKGLLPACDAALLGAAIAGLAFELGEQVKMGADIEMVAGFATALVMGGITALPSAPPKPDSPPIDAAPRAPAGADSPS